MPHTYVLLFSFIIIAAILSWIVPAGEFERVMVGEREIINPDSFAYVTSNPQGIFEVLKSIPRGFARTQDISYFLFVTGGSFLIINKTGMIESALSRIVSSLKGKEALVIPVVVLIMGLAGSTIGLSEETIVFIALGVSLARAIGYDSLIGVGMIGLGAGVGFTSGFMNPFSVGVAQSIAELPLFSGIELRLVLFVVLWIVTSLYLILYGKRVKADLSNSIVYDEEMAARSHSDYQDLNSADNIEFTTKQKIIAAVFVGGFVIIAYGVMSLGWFITEIGAVFLGMGLISGLIYGMRPGDLADNFIEGAKDMMYAALIVGLAQSLVIIMEDAMILDTLINGLTGAISNLPSVLSAAGMYVVQIIINFFISSGSGQAAVTMPIMIPLADALDVTRQTAVLSYQLGNGFLDSIMPMSGILMAQLAIADIPYKKWVKFAMPLMGIWLAIGLVFIIFAQLVGYGPF
ncbi:putative basic amino acid antiporter YfcC [Aerococcaceae bacterium INB8]|uniref:Putative basic amino acid antiporter YfcC n=1 Tax=Ruoffia halotolerans TaxID=2748684 RepID=A0A839A5M3_9LACT|nr:Na+/H+ antiporter NhaC family protein [Ruoffia halotolerans]MBA5729058.1 putative basic amino acid antiporter YfcC [Ruoffia halotolerans]